MKADYTTPPCCNRKSVAVMDYKWRVFGEPKEIKVNRVCLNCGAHWAGSIGEVVQYTKKDWDVLMNDTFSTENI